MRPNIELHIEELVLEDFRPGDRRRIGDALVVELERLLDERGLSAFQNRNLEISMVDGGEIDLVPGSRAEVVGSRVAGAVYGGLSRWAGSREQG